MCEKCILFISLFTVWWEICLKSQKFQLWKIQAQRKPHPLPAVGVAYCRSVCVFLWDGNVSLLKHCGEGAQTTWSYSSLSTEVPSSSNCMTDIVTATAKEFWKLSGCLWQVSTNGSTPYVEVSTHHCFNTNSLIQGSASFPCNVGVVRHTPRSGHGLDSSTCENIFSKSLPMANP